MRLSIIVPAYNEEKNLKINIKKFNDYLREQPYEYEIIIVNDGSTDNTKKIAEDLEAQNNNIKLIDNKINKGKGAAVRQGLMSANGDYILYLDADNATSIDHLKKVWPYFKKGYDIVIGSRNPKDTKNAKQVLPQPIWKRFLGICGNYVIRLLAVKNIHDTQCGFKAFTKEAVKEIISKTKINGWAFDVEILALAQHMNYKIAIIPVSWVNSKESRVNIKGYFSTLKEVYKIRKKIKKFK